jgi:4-hydroxy-3-polyprenylbenzoate decarboxylase
LKKIVVSISGASGFSLGMKFFKLLPDNLEKHLILTDNSKVVAEHEENIYSESQIDAPISSGSFGADAMIIIPCSMNTLAKISVGLADNLTSRTASVMIKERKTLVLAPRELPLSPIPLENMLKLSRIGVVIAPPIIGYYSDIKTLDDMENFLIGKWFDILGIENHLYKRWQVENLK